MEVNVLILKRKEGNSHSAGSLLKYTDFFFFEVCTGIIGNGNGFTNLVFH